KTLILGLIAKLVADEARAWLPSVSQRLLNLALKCLPPDQQERYGEEWAADLESYPASLSRTIRAIGFLCAGWRIGGILPERLREIARFLQLDLRLSWFDIKVRIIMLVG